MKGWLFPVPNGFKPLFTQSRWYWRHVCGWRADIRTQTPTPNFQSRLGSLMHKERRA